MWSMMEDYNCNFITSSFISFLIKWRKTAARVFVGSSSTVSHRAASLLAGWLVRRNHYPNGALNALSRLVFLGIRVVLD